MNEKSNSKWLSLATASILEQAPSCLTLENKGLWRVAGIGAVILLAIAPSLSFLLFANKNFFELKIGWEFFQPLARSLIVASLVTVTSVVVGLPAGFLAGIYHFPARKLLLGLLAVPLIIPSFLWAIGLSTLRINLGFSETSFLSGAGGTVITFTCLGIPLIIYFCLISARNLSASQISAVRIMGGEKCLFFHGMKSIFSSAVMAGILVGILTLSDPGPGQILGYRSVASEILVSFAALFDFQLAASQGAILSLSIILLTFPLSIKMAPIIASGWLGKDMQTSRLHRTKQTDLIGSIVFLTLFILIVCLPLSGLIFPSLRDFQWQRAWSEVQRTAGNTLFYSFLGGLIATLLGFFLAICAGRKAKHRILLVTLLLLLFSLPPALNALGWVQIASVAPVWLDPLLRSRFSVCFVLALHFLPITSLIAMRAFGMTSSSWTYAAAIAGISLPQYLFRVLGPVLLFPFLFSIGIVGLLGTTDIATVLLLRPPGEDSLPIQIFTIMANAPETLVSSLCTLYFVSSATILFILILLLSRKKSK